VQPFVLQYSRPAAVDRRRRRRIAADRPATDAEVVRDIIPGWLFLSAARLAGAVFSTWRSSRRCGLTIPLSNGPVS